MRQHTLIMAILIFLSGSALAQQQQPPGQQQVPGAQQPPAGAPQAAPPVQTRFDPANNRLDALLLKWEESMRNVQTLQAHCTRTNVDRAFNAVDVYEGDARYMRPNLAILDMFSKKNPQMYDKFICTGTFLYEFNPANKTIRVHELPPPKAGQVADDNFLSFLFGMKAEEARKRYDLRLAKEDQHYIYIEIFPMQPSDKADFARARLTLTNGTFLPRQLWFQQPNSNEVTWDMPQIQSNVKLNRADFAAPQLPRDWKVEKGEKPAGAAQAPPPAAQPRVARPQK